MSCTSTATGRCLTSRPAADPCPAARPTVVCVILLADWLVPVRCHLREVRYPDARDARPAAAPSLDEALDHLRAAPAEAAAAQDPLAAAGGAFVGRDDLFYQLEAD